MRTLLVNAIAALVGLLSVPAAYGESESSSSGDGVHAFVVPVFPCTELGIDTNVGRKLSAGLIGGSCADQRPANGETPINEVDNTFVRFRSIFHYSPFEPVWESGWRAILTTGMESDEFRSKNGSNATVVFWLTSLGFGYQYVSPWNLTVRAGVLYGYLYAAHNQRDYATDESTKVRSFLDRNTRTNDHMGTVLNIGYLW